MLERAFVARLCHISVVQRVELQPHCTAERERMRERMREVTDENNERRKGRQTKHRERVTAKTAEVGGSPGTQVGGGEGEEEMVGEQRRRGGREGGRQPCEEPCEWKGKKSGQWLQGEGLARSIVCSVYEKPGQGVRLRNSLQWLSQCHMDHHVLPPSLPP